MKTIKHFAANVRAIEGADRTLRFTVSTDALDRYNDTVSATGWETKNFMRNPVILWGHDYEALPVGKALRLDRTAHTLEADVEFAARDVSDFADRVFKMSKAGFLKGMSVGFMPLESRPNEHGGTDFIRQELLEISVVPVPANADALAKSAGGRPGAVMKAGKLSESAMAIIFYDIYALYQAGKLSEEDFSNALALLCAGQDHGSKAVRTAREIKKALHHVAIRDFFKQQVREFFKN